MLVTDLSFQQLVMAGQDHNIRKIQIILLHFEMKFLTEGYVLPLEH